MKKEIEILRISGNEKYIQKDFVAEESKCEFYLNDRLISRISCTFKHLNYLLIGELCKKNIFPDLKRSNILIHNNNAILQCDSFSECIKKTDERYRIDINKIFVKMKALLTVSELFNSTGGIHIAGITDSKSDDFAYVGEDISRMNAIEKCVGYKLLNRLRSSIIFTTSRINSDIVQLLSNADIPIIITKAAVTDLAIDLACELGITIIGFLRGNRANVYSHFERVYNERIF